MNPEDRPLTKAKEPLSFSTAEVLLLLSISLTWAIAIFFASGKELPEDNLEDLLFGAASVALFLLSFLVAILAIFGWKTLIEIATERADAGVQKESQKLSLAMERLSKENNARLYAGLGMVFGRVGRGATLGFRAEREDLLRLAIDHSRDAYKQLCEIDSHYQWRTLNNLIFYSAMLGSNDDPAFMLKKVEELKDEIAGFGENAQDVLLTYCRTVIEFSADPELREQVQAMLRSIVQNTADPERQKEAKLYLTSFEDIEDP